MWAKQASRSSFEGTADGSSMHNVHNVQQNRPSLLESGISGVSRWVAAGMLSSARYTSPTCLSPDCHSLQNSRKTHLEQHNSSDMRSYEKICKYDFQDRHKTAVE